MAGLADARRGPDRVGRVANADAVVTASDGIPCHGVDGPQEDRFQDGLEPTRKTRP